MTMGAFGLVTLLGFVLAARLWPADDPEEIEHTHPELPRDHPLIARFEGRRWFPVTKDQVAKAETWYHRYGRWKLLLSWIPVIGDPLTIVAGVLREPFPVFLALITVAKTARYLAIAALTLG